MAFSPENLKIWVDSREYSRIIQTATYPPFTKGTPIPLDPIKVIVATDAAPLWKSSTTRAHVFVDVWGGPEAARNPALWETWWSMDGPDDIAY